MDDLFKIAILDIYNNIISIEEVSDQTLPFFEKDVYVQITTQDINFIGNSSVGIWLSGGTYFVPYFKYDFSTNAVVARPQSDIDNEIAAAPPAPPTPVSQLDRIESQVAYTAMMTDTLIEEEE